MKIETKVEGIIISKLPYRERDCIASILLKNGTKISVIFYGGLGGGEKKKSGLIELGYALILELKENTKEANIFVAKEWQVKWFHKNIRLNHKLFYQLVFVCELIGSISSDDEMTYKILSNAIYRLDTSHDKNDHLVIFFSKLIVGLGILPDLHTCSVCGQELINIAIEIDPQHGGFCCQSCCQHKIINPEVGRTLMHIISLAASRKYSELILESEQNREYARILLNYLCFQFQIRQSDFKSLSVVL